jgi:hypothetical protein
MWALWFVAKRRQWNIRESIRRASRRLTGRKEPRTPRVKSRREGTMFKENTGRERDVEKGISAKTLPKQAWAVSDKERSRSSSREDDARGPNKMPGFAR